jgi:hypothetical protein
MKFKKKPVIIDAFEWKPGRTFPSPEFDGLHAKSQMDGSDGEILESDNRKLNIKTLEGVISASPGDWIIRGIQGEYYPCKPDIFEKTYERVGE